MPRPDAEVRIAMEIGMLLAIGAAIAFGGGDFSGGLASRRAPALAVAAGAQAVGLALLLVAMGVARPPAPDPAALLTAAMAGVCGGLGLLALYRGLSLGSMGLVTALSGIGSVAIPLLVSGLLRHAAIAPLQWAGVGLALAAAAAASGATFAGVRPRALLLAGVAAVGFGLWFVLLDLAAPSGELWTLVISRAAATLLIGLLALALLRVRPVRPASRLVLLAGALDVTGNTAFVLARATVPVGLAAALSGVYPIVTMLLARAVTGERPPALALLAVGMAVTGIVLISLGG